MDGSRVDRRSASTCSLETWKPQLTVPRGPQLQVVRRLSAPRWPGSTLDLPDGMGILMGMMLCCDMDKKKYILNHHSTASSYRIYYKIIMNHG